MTDSNPQIPEPIAQAIQNNPELLRQLANPEFINSINDQLARANLAANWCIACGASRSLEPEVASVVNPPLTVEEVRQIGKRLSGMQ